MNLRGVRRVSVQNFWKIIYELHTSSVVRIIEARRLLSRTNIDPRGMGWRRGGEGETNGENVETRCTPNQANSILLERLEGREPSKRVTSGNKGCTHFSWGTFFGNRWPDYSSHELKKNHVYQITEIRVLDTNRSIRLSVWQRSFPRWTIIDFEGIFIRKRGRNTIVSITYQMDACSI